MCGRLRGLLKGENLRIRKRDPEGEVSAKIFVQLCMAKPVGTVREEKDGRQDRYSDVFRVTSVSEGLVKYLLPDVRVGSHTRGCILHITSRRRYILEDEKYGDGTFQKLFCDTMPTEFRLQSVETKYLDSVVFGWKTFQADGVYPELHDLFYGERE